MILLLDKMRLYSTFEANSFEELENSINQTSPSMVEYHLNNLISISDNNSYLNKSNIEKTLYLYDYLLYLDYSQNIYIEVSQQNDDYTTSSLLMA